MKGKSLTRFAGRWNGRKAVQNKGRAAPEGTRRAQCREERGGGERPAPRLTAPGAGSAPSAQGLCLSPGLGKKPDEAPLASPATVKPAPLDTKVSPPETELVTFSPAAPRRTASTLTAPGGRATRGTAARHYEEPPRRTRRAKAGKRPGSPLRSELRTAPLLPPPPGPQPAGEPVGKE